MSTLIDRRESRSTNGRTSTESSTPAERLRTTMAACRVQFTWFGTKKSLTAEQKAQAAEPFDAEGQFLSAGKKLLDTKHNNFRAVTAIRGKITDHWRELTLPFPEPGVRLIKHDQIEAFDQSMADLEAELDEAVRTLDQHFDELVTRAQRAVRGVAAQDIRDSHSTRREVVEQLSRVQSSLDAMLIDRPRRRILRNASAGGEA